jgi:hypothetical protein
MPALLLSEIERFVREDPANGWPGLEGPLFGPPLLGLAAASDPLFATFKAVVGPQHLTPTGVPCEARNPMAMA